MEKLEDLKRSGVVYDKAVDGNDFIVRTQSFYTASVLCMYGYRFHSVVKSIEKQKKNLYYFLTRDFKHA